MNQSFVLHIDNDTTFDISFGEIMFLSALKANKLSEYSDEIYVIQIVLSNPVNSRKEKFRTVIRLQTSQGEYTAYSYSQQWESALSKCFESILYQLQYHFINPVEENTN